MSTAKSTTHSVGEFKIQIRPVGPTQEQMDETGRAILASPAVREMLGGRAHRLLRLDTLESDAAKTDRPRNTRRVQATICDYEGHRMLIADASLADPAGCTVQECSQAIPPSSEELDTAIAFLRRDEHFGRALHQGDMVAYPAMPPLVGEVQPDGSQRRLLGIGLLPRREGMTHEIVGVDPHRGEVVRFEGGAPPNSHAQQGFCGIPFQQQSTTRSAAGQVDITIISGGQTLWTFRAIRPAASSGTNGSGIELRNVRHRGKLLLYRAHVPFLNVKYDNDACGPYRDWQNQEGMIQATGIDVAPGFRLCNSPATSAVETGSDAGNFLGTAIYVDGGEVVLVCEMEAGWYRYVSQWRFHVDGTLRPRFGFSAVSNSCVCTTHHHHAYWRFDFDIGTAGDNLVQEFNKPPLGSSNWHDKTFEIKRPRDPARNRRWRVKNAVTGDAYDIVPGHDDGVSSAMPDAPYGRGDVWITRYRGTEIDDGVVATGPPYEVNIDQWVNGESIAKKDVVVWYAAHFTHDVHSDPPGVHGHIVGPDLRKVSW